MALRHLRLGHLVSSFFELIIYFVSWADNMGQGLYRRLDAYHHDQLGRRGGPNM